MRNAQCFICRDVFIKVTTRHPLCPIHPFLLSLLSFLAFEQYYSTFPFLYSLSMSIPLCIFLVPAKIAAHYSSAAFHMPFFLWTFPYAGLAPRCLLWWVLCSLPSALPAVLRHHWPTSEPSRPKAFLYDALSDLPLPNHPKIYPSLNNCRTLQLLPRAYQYESLMLLFFTPLHTNRSSLRYRLVFPSMCNSPYI